MSNENSVFFCYKGKPLVRKGNILYYGSMQDEYVVMLQITGTRPENGLDLASNVRVQLMRTGKDVKPQDIIVKKGEKEGLFRALELAEIWLSRVVPGKAEE